MKDFMMNITPAKIIKGAMIEISARLLKLFEDPIEWEFVRAEYNDNIYVTLTEHYIS